MNPPAAVAKHARLHDHDHDHHHHDHDHAPEHQHEHAHHHAHSHGCGCGAHHDTTEAGLKRRLLAVFAAAGCLAIGAILPFFRPEQVEVAALWSLLGALLAGAPIAWDTLAGLQAKSSENSDFYMNQFMTLAVAACIASDQYLTGGVVAIVLLVGHILENRSMLGASEAILSLLNLSRHHARRIVDGDREEEIDAEHLKPGDRIRIRPGDIIPTDGTVRQGRSTVNQANITGESLPVEVVEGAEIFAGTVNVTGTLLVEVTRAGGDTVLGRVQHIVEEAQSTRAPIVRLTEEYARYYMPLILLIAGAVLFFTHDFARAISIIIVSIPCTFVMAGPTAMVAALASAARLGILVKSTRFFEAASDIDTVVFDKTGTLTTGKLHVAKILGADPSELLRLAAALEQHSTHPIARAITAHAMEKSIALPASENFSEEHGLGVMGTVNGEPILLGRRSWLQEKKISGLPTEDALPHCAAISIARADTYAGTIYLSDTLRPESTGLKARLEEEGVGHFVMLTGDRRTMAQEICARLGFTNFEADCLPAQKRDAVEALKRAGRRVAVVGDGVNDAPALAAGHVSIAMGSLGSDVAIQTADIALMSSDLRRVADFLQLAHRTMSVVNQNMLCGLAFIALAILLSSAGFIPPIAAAFLHELGAFFVIFNSARLLKFEGSGNPK